jgi:hypothetical protein
VSRHKPKKPADNNSQLPFDPDWYETNSSEIAVIMGYFFLRYLNLLYRKFDGDFVLCMVLGEIANHNVSGFFSRRGSSKDMLKQLENYDQRVKLLTPTNAFSVSEATGIPRETVRRKIEKLQKKGWVVKSKKGELLISETVTSVNILPKSSTKKYLQNSSRLATVFAKFHNLT